MSTQKLVVTSTRRTTIEVVNDDAAQASKVIDLDALGSNALEQGAITATAEVQEARAEEWTKGVEPETNEFQSVEDVDRHVQITADAAVGEAMSEVGFDGVTARPLAESSQW